MFPYLSIGDVYISFFSIGFSITCIIFLLLSFSSLKEYGLNENDAINIPAIVCISSIIFSKIPLGLLYDWKISDYFNFWKTGHTLVGGLVISAIATIMYCKVRKIDFVKTLGGLTYPSLLALSSYRFFVCFMVGCCYGIESEKYGINFPPESFAGNGREIKLLPSQLVESLLFLIFGILIYKLRRKIEVEKIIVLGLCFLIIERIIAEQIRGDIREKIIKADNFGLSIWLLFLMAILIITDLYINILRPWINDLKIRMEQQK